MSGQGQIKGTLQMENLCWYCKHAVPRMNRNGNYICGCEWSLHRAPVAGWEAEMTYKTGAGLAWAVYYCPKYVNDALPDIAPWHGTTTAGAHTLAKHNWDKHGVDIFPDADPWNDKDQRKVVHRRIKDRTPEEIALAKEKARKKNQAYYERNKDRILAKQHALRALKNLNKPPRVSKYGPSSNKKEYMRNYYLANRERKLQMNKDYYHKKHPTAARVCPYGSTADRSEYNRRYRAANLEKIKAYQKRYYQEMKEAKAHESL